MSPDAYIVCSIFYTSLWFQGSQGRKKKLNLKTYLPSSFGDDHFSSKIVKLLPKIFRLQMTFDALQFRTSRFGHSDIWTVRTI